MSMLFRSLACFTLLLAAPALPATTPLEVFGRLPSVEDVAISPDGTQLAYVTTVDDERVITINATSDGKLQRSFRYGNAKIRGISWADARYLLVETSSPDMSHSNDLPFVYISTKVEFWLLQVCDVLTGRCVDPIRFDTTAMRLNSIFAPPVLRKVDGKISAYVVAASLQNNLGLPTLYKFIPGSARPLRLVEVGQPSTRWLLGEDGEVKARSAYDEKTHRWSLTVRVDGKMKPVFNVDADIEQPFIVGFSPDNSAVWLEMLENGETIRKAVTLKDGALQSLPAEFLAYRQLFRDLYTGRVIGGRTGKDLDFADNHLRETWRVIVNRFSNERVDLISATTGFEKLVIRVEGKRDGYIYALFDTDTYQFQGLSNVYEGLTQLAEVKPFVYRAADGFEVPAFITLPRDHPEKNLPLIVLPHGGPQARDDGSFDWLAQALAAQGYAVLQPNFRGSALGWAHISAGFGEWGGKMQTDLSDGVRYLVNSGAVDPKRVCIVGESYGGYAALAGATFDKDIYRCAVSIAGISDLPKFKGWTEDRMGRSDSAFGRYLYRYLGADDLKDPLLISRSPARKAENVNVPILLIHGRDDTVVPFEQSELMISALKRAGKSYELVELKKEDHWLSRSATRLQALQETVRFLKQHNPPD